MPAINKEESPHKEEQKAVVQPPKDQVVTPTIDWDAAKKHLETVKTTGFELTKGKDGNNPFDWWLKVGKPLEKDLEANGDAPNMQLFNQIMSLKIPVAGEVLRGDLHRFKVQQ